MAGTAYIKMGKNMQGKLMFWIYDGDNNGIPHPPTKKTPLQMFPVPNEKNRKELKNEHG